MKLSLMAKPCHAQCLLCSLSLMLSVTYKPSMLGVVMLNVIILSVLATSFNIPSDDLPFDLLKLSHLYPGK